MFKIVKIYFSFSILIENSSKLILKSVVSFSNKNYILYFFNAYVSITTNDIRILLLKMISVSYTLVKFQTKN